MYCKGFVFRVQNNPVVIIILEQTHNVDLKMHTRIEFVANRIRYVKHSAKRLLT